jgi:hypothetical protein
VSLLVARQRSSMWLALKQASIHTRMFNISYFS